MFTPFAHLQQWLDAKKECDLLVAELEEVEAELNKLKAQKHQTTLEELQDKPEDMEILKELSARQRLALYNFHTARAYRLNDDLLRKASLSVRNDIMTNSKSPKNTIPFDREVKVTKPNDFLPGVLHDPLPKESVGK